MPTVVSRSVVVDSPEVFHVPPLHRLPRVPWGPALVVGDGRAGRSRARAVRARILGVPTAPAVLGLFAVLHVVFGVVVGVWRGRLAELRTVLLPGLAGAASMGSGVTISRVRPPWADDTYLPGLLVMAAVMYGLQFLLSRHRGGPVRAGR